jgi:cobalt transporter subunit CbtA
MFRSMLRAAALAGIVAGVLLTTLQAFTIAPLIRDAERIEQSAAAYAAHAERHEASPSADEITRLASTGVANVVLATGFALMLSGAMVLRGARGWRAGLAFGIAGYAVVFVAPSLGLPPSLPGVAEAPLSARTAWWLVTVACSAAGLGLVAFGGGVALRALGIALLVVPHTVGAPQPAVRDAQAASDLAHAFVRNAYMANAAFWIVLGTLVGALRHTPSGARGSEVTPPSVAP